MYEVRSDGWCIDREIDVSGGELRGGYRRVWSKDFVVIDWFCSDDDDDEAKGGRERERTRLKYKFWTIVVHQSVRSTDLVNHCRRFVESADFASVEVIVAERRRFAYCQLLNVSSDTEEHVIDRSIRCSPYRVLVSSPGSLSTVSAFSISDWCDENASRIVRVYHHW